jgi:hypothetical protein
MKNILLAAALVAGVVSGFAQSAASIKQLQWLEGSWKNEKTGNVETWKTVNDTALGGINTHTDDDGEVIVDEMIRVVKRGNEFYYIPLVPDQNKGKEVEFKIISFTPRSFVAENKAHDFPQRIAYEQKDATHLYAYIEGLVKGKNKKIEFSFIRK